MAARNMTGVTKLEKADPRHSLRNTMASRSRTRSMGGATATSVLQGAPGEYQEDVLQGAPPHQYRGRPQPVAGDKLGRAVAVPRVHQDPVGQHLHTLPGAVEPG